MKKIRFELKTVPAMLLALTVVTYGLLIPWVGFYWDDWNFAWISHFLGAGEFIPAFQPFRPFLGPIFAATTSIFHESAIGWQLFALLARFLIAYAAWWALGKVWPAHKRQVLLVSLFVLVFPGYGQQWVAFTHVNQELLPLLAYILSFGVTAWALKSKDKFIPLTLLALLLMFLGLCTTEYFIGFEAIRFLLIWVALAGDPLKQRIKHFTPYLFLWLANAAWLTYYYRAGGYHSYGMPGSKLLGDVPALLGELVHTLSTAGFAAWFQVFGIFSQTAQSASLWLSLALGALTFAAIVFYLSKLDLPEAVPGEDHWALQAILIGLVGILVGRLPSFVAGLPLSLDFSWDRFMLSMLLGACLLLAGLVELLIKSDRRKFYVIGLLVALSVSHQFDNANAYRRDWDQQKDFFWQLSWRIPAMKPGTILLTHVLPIQYESDLSLSAPLNWIYAPKPGSRQLDYILLYSTLRLGPGGFPALQPNLPVDIPFRTAAFHGSTSNTVVIYFPAEGCLKVLDPIYANRKTFAALPYMLTDAITLSNPSRILPDAPPPSLPSLFGAEPQRGWCYFYEKAELARQVGDWAQVVRLGKQAFKLGLAPQEAYEWLPFIEAEARAGSVDEAQKLSIKVSKENPLLTPGLCEIWDRVRAGGTGKADATLSQLKCQP
ncbi:MAG: hypothetical protein WA821_12225 [Anaerolineales bacterium]